jgi:hypothetical protein
MPGEEKNYLKFSHKINSIIYYIYNWILTVLQVCPRATEPEFLNL